MTTKELITLLQEQDPEGTKEVTLQYDVVEPLEIFGVNVFSDEITLLGYDLGDKIRT